ncbi:MAG: Gfo/Idh/MocA family oxidoreductase [Bryobacteraceae bacterium]|jgi:predicted dehydrogenase
MKSAFTIIPALSARTYAANEKVNVAVVGCGSMGMGDIGRMVKVPTINIVALCDVDSRDPVKRNPAKGSYDFTGVRMWADFREMLDKQKDIEAVFVATPDHTHAVISMRAMEMGKHVDCEKPQARTISEMRAMAAAAKKYKVATQCDMEGHAFDELRGMVEWVKAGVIGEVREVHIWEGGGNRPRGYPGIKAPLPVPDYLNWDLWLGPAREQPYHAGLHPGSWRGWWEFGTGIMGDWCGHLFDCAVWSLDLGAPTSVEPKWDGGDVSEVAWQSAIIKFNFPARGKLPPVTLTWYDGGNKPPRPEELDPGEELPRGGGYLFVGSKGKLVAQGRKSYLESDHGWLLPRSRMKDFQPPPQTLPRVKDQEFLNEWLDAIKGGKPATCSFDGGYSNRIFELGLLGNVAVRTGKPIEWDAKNMRAKGLPEADRLIHAEYRKGWEL